LTSWCGGQILRIIKQQKVESNLNMIISDLKTVATQLNEASEKINIVGLGSKSYVNLNIGNINDSNDIGQIMFFSGGVGPVYDCSGYYIDLNTPEKTMIPFNIGNITESTVVQHEHFKLDKTNGVRINCFFVTRRGHFASVLRMKYINGVWKKAIHVASFTEVYFKSCDKGFPIETDEEKRHWGE
jgi:hypothetical protein